MELHDGSRVGVVGGGPAGTLTSYFMLEMAERVDLRIEVDVYEARDFQRTGPAGCNMCGGIVSESLVQMLATDGVNLPPSVVQRGIDSYVLHTDVGSVRIGTPREEMRIAAVHRGNGPKDAPPGQWESFDHFLLSLACEKGARHIHARVKDLAWTDGRPVVKIDDGPGQDYDLLVGATGINGVGYKLFEKLGFQYRTPKTTKTSMSELLLGQDQIKESLGNAMHVFLLDIPRLEFAALIPKGEYVSVCLLGEEIDQDLVEGFVRSEPVRRCLKQDWHMDMASCHCYPRINMGGTRNFFADRVVLVGDCGVSRLYKDGIGAAYRAAKACAVTAVLHGVSKADFERHYWPRCRRMRQDNALGSLLFMSAGLFRKLPFLNRSMLNLTAGEQRNPKRGRAMSSIIWDTFTGSAPYSDVVLRSLRPRLILSFISSCFAVLLRRAQRIDFESQEALSPPQGPDRPMQGRTELPVMARASLRKRPRRPRQGDGRLRLGHGLKDSLGKKGKWAMRIGAMGKVYQDGESIVSQGDLGDCMYVVQEGRAEVVVNAGGHEVSLSQLEPGDVFGEMALFSKEPRSATVRARGQARVLTVDKRAFFKRVQEDPTLALRILKKMSERVRKLDEEVANLKQ